MTHDNTNYKDKFINYNISSINYKINSLIIDISSMNYINVFNIILKLLINN